MKQPLEDDLSYEITFYEKLLEKDPEYAEVLSLLSELYTKTGQHAKGLATDLRLTKLCPEDPIATTISPAATRS